MKKITKIVSLCILVAMTIALTACGGSNGNSGFNSEVIKEGVLTIGISADYPPYESLDDAGKLIGFDVDMANELVKYMKTTDGKEYKTEFVKMDFANIVSSMQTGQVDVGVACFTYDAKRQCLFSTPYMDSSQVIVVKSDSGIKSIADLKGKKVAAGEGTTGCAAAKEKITGAEIVTPGEYVMQFEMLRVNQIDAIVCDKAVAEGYEKSSKDFKVIETLIDESASVIVAKGHDALLKEVNSAVEQFKKSDSYKQLLTKWGL